MGSWSIYNLVLGPGERDPELVAAELRAALPEAVGAVISEHTELEWVITDGTPSVWVEDGLVHWSTGENPNVATLNWKDLVPSLPVAARWASAAWQQEAGYVGGVWLYGWVDGAFELVDERSGREGMTGRDAVDYAEREWDVVASDRHDVPRAHWPAEDVRVEDPSVPDGFGPVDRKRPADVVPADLLEGSPERRRGAAERLYVAVSEGTADPGLDPDLVAALDDDAVKWGAAATLRALDLPGDAVVTGLTDDDPDVRQAAARYCLLVGMDDAPLDALARALEDPDAAVRTTAAKVFRYGAMSTPSTSAPLEEFAPSLLAAAEDPDSKVRAHATVAAVSVAFHPRASHPAAGANALVDGLTDEAAVVRDHLVPHAEHVFLKPLVRTPDDAHATMLYRLTEAIQAGQRVPNPVGDTRDLAEAFAVHGDGVEAVLPDLVALGWDGEEATVARAVVGAYVDEHGERAVRDAANRVGHDPDEVLASLPSP